MRSHNITLEPIEDVDFGVRTTSEQYEGGKFNIFLIYRVAQKECNTYDQ